MLQRTGLRHLLCLLSFLFSLRVLGQAVQRWVPLSFLPPFDAFQGSNLPYWLLLSVQLLILGVMIRATWSAYRGTLKSNSRWGRVLAWLGAIYMTGSVIRIAVGLFFPSASSWFTAWIPATFHLVLAGFVLTLAGIHLSDHPRTAMADKR
jgi:chromate transport protein ChrA